MGAVGAFRNVLRTHDARSLVCASAASQLGDWLYNAALLGYVYQATHSAAWVGTATVVRLLPFVLLGPVGGMIADRYDKRLVLMAGDTLRMFIMLWLSAAIAAKAPVAIVIVLTALSSTAGTAERPAALALLPRLVPESELGAANALLHTVQDVGVVVGPALGGVLLLVAPDAVAFAANAASFAVSLAFVSSLRSRPPALAARPVSSARAELTHGLRSARSTAFVLPLFGVVAMAELVYGAQTVQLVLYAQQRLHLGEAGYGYLLAALGAGGVLSAFVNPRLASSAKVATVAVSAGVLFCCTEFVYGGTDLVATAVLVTVLGGAAMVACEVVTETTLQRVVEPDVLGRILGVYRAVSVGAMVAGAVLASALVAATSLRLSLLALGAATVAVIAASRVQLRGLDAVSRRRLEALRVRLDVLERLPLTTGVPRAVLEQLASAAQFASLPAGVDVVVQGAPSHAFYVVLDGSVVVHRDDSEIARLAAGDYFGEVGLLDQAPRNASVTTVEDSRLLRLDGAVLMDALTATPSMVTALERSVGQRRTFDIGAAGQVALELPERAPA